MLRLPLCLSQIFDHILFKLSTSTAFGFLQEQSSLPSFSLCTDVRFCMSVCVVCLCVICYLYAAVDIETIHGFTRGSNRLVQKLCFSRKL